jgi:hypothetical protein
MVFGFDPRTLIEEDQEDKKKETKEAIDSVLTFEEEAEKNETFIRKQSKISDAFDGAFKALREHKFEKKFGKDAYIDEKIKEDPEYRDPRLYTDEENKTYYRSEMESMRGIMEGVSIFGDDPLPPVEDMNENQLKFYKKGKYKTLASEAGETDTEEKPKFKTEQP